jgi:hypothetical protein
MHLARLLAKAVPIDRSPAETVSYAGSQVRAIDPGQLFERELNPFFLLLFIQKSHAAIIRAKPPLRNA